MTVRRVLILSTTTGYQLRSFGEAAAKLGVTLQLATDACHQLDDPWRDQAIPVRFADDGQSVAAVVRAAEGGPISGAIAVGDRPVVLAARVALALGLRGHSIAAARASAHKKLARERFAAAGLPAPWFVEVTPELSADDVLARVRFPAVVKPLTLSGSRGVIRVDTPPQLDAAVRRVRALLSRPDVRALEPDPSVLVEGFIPGREYAVEGVVTGGRLQTFAIFDKPDPLDGPYFEETVYVTPAPLPAVEERRIQDAVQRAIAALELCTGAVHAECRVGGDEVVVLEVAARPIGGLCSRILRFEDPVGGAPVTLEEVLLRHALGESVAHYHREATAAAVMMIPIPRPGWLKGADGEEAARQVAGVEDIRITAKPDQLLETLPEAGSYLGFIFARMPTAAAAEDAVRRAHGHLRFRIVPQIPVNVPGA